MILRKKSREPNGYFLQRDSNEAMKLKRRKTWGYHDELSINSVYLDPIIRHIYSSSSHHNIMSRSFHLLAETSMTHFRETSKYNRKDKQRKSNEKQKTKRITWHKCLSELWRCEPTEECETFPLFAGYNRDSNDLVLPVERSCSNLKFQEKHFKTKKFICVNDSWKGRSIPETTNGYKTIVINNLRT